MKLRDINGNTIYPEVIDNTGVDIKKSIDNIKNRLSTLESNTGISDDVKTAIDEINSDLDALETSTNTAIQNLQTSTNNSIQSLRTSTDNSIELINSRIDLLESSDVTTELMRPYRGPSNLYVNHNYTGTSDGSSSKPFKSFAELNVYLNQSKIINKSLTINITTSGNYPEALVMSNFSGTGSLKFEFNADGKMQGTDTIYVGINLSHVLLPVIINKFRVFGCSHGILLYDSGYTEVANSIISAKNYGVLYSNTNGYVHDTDFCSSYTPVCAEGGGSTVYCVTLSGNAGASGTGEAFRVLLGGTIYYGTTASTQSIPKGSMNERAGRIFKCGTVIEQASWNYPSSVPDNPTTTMTYSNLYNATSIGTYQYKWSNWVTDACKSGVYSSYGDKAGHLFFDLSSIRSFLNSGTVVDGATITLTRANSGGDSAAVSIYVGGSSCSSASGTPSYSNRAQVGTLAWGETKTFTLNKNIVNGIKSGSINSITTYGSAYSNITACSIVLKVKK